MQRPKEILKLVKEVKEDNSAKHHTIPTGIHCLDEVLGGGIDLGSKVQFVAESSTGKSTISLQICKSFCKRNLNVLYIDTENSITKELLISTGCIDYYNNLSEEQGEIIVIKESDFDTVSQKLDLCFKSEYFSLIVIDSLASLVNNCYVDLNNTKDIKALTNNNTNYESRPLNLFINKYSNLAKKYNAALLYVNQYRNKIDPKNGTILKEFGNKSVRYSSDIIIKIKKDKEELWQDSNGIYDNSVKDNIGNPATHSKLIFTVDKSNKLLSGKTSIGFIKYGYGIDEFIDNIINKISCEEITKEGKYYSLPDDTTKYDGLINLINHFVCNAVDNEYESDEEYESFTPVSSETISAEFIDADEDE